MNVNAEGAADDGGWTNDNTFISANGRYVVFQSYNSTNLVEGLQQRTDFVADVFVKDMNTGEVTLVSLNRDEPQIPGAGFGFVNNSNIGGGRYVAFTTAVALDPNDTNSARDIYVRDLETGSLTLASATPDGAAGNRETYLGHNFSPDGKYLAFFSFATNLTGGNDPVLSAYLRNMETGVTTLISPTPVAIHRVNGFSFTADSRYLAFATNEDLTPDDSGSSEASGGGAEDVYILDLKTGALRLGSMGQEVGTYPLNSQPSLTPDGRYLAFVSNSQAIVPGDTNQVSDIYLRVLIAKTVRIDPVTGDNRINASESSTAVPITGTSSAIGGTVTISVDGETVATATVRANGNGLQPLTHDPLRRKLLRSLPLYATRQALPPAMAQSSALLARSG